MKMKVAVIGSGITGLAAAWTLAQAGHEVVVYEKDKHVGGHAWTQDVDGIAIDVGFMVFNRVTYPNLMEFFENLPVEMEESDMSFSISLDGGRGCEWGSNGLCALLAQKRNLFSPSFLYMICEICFFEREVLKFLKRAEGRKDYPNIEESQTLGQFLNDRKFSKKFLECYLIPVCSSVWSCPAQTVLGFSAVEILSFLRNHHFLQIFGRPQWLTLKGRSWTYVKKIVQVLEIEGSEVKTKCGVVSIKTGDPEEFQAGVEITDEDGKKQVFQKCIIATHAPDALAILGNDATAEERRILGAFQYNESEIYLHRDASLMPKSKSAWSAWNFLGGEDGQICLTYWLNKLQNLGDTGLPILVTLNPERTPEMVVRQWKAEHPIPTAAAAQAAREMPNIQGKRGLWFCGAYQGYGFHEDGFKAGIAAAKDLLDVPFQPLPLVKKFTPTCMESISRAVVIQFLKDFIRVGHLELLEAGGTVMSFGEQVTGLGPDAKITRHRCSIRIIRPAFYWKVATRADLGVADAFIDGDFTCVGDMMNFLLILIANRDYARTPGRVVRSTRPWWNPGMITASLGSAIAYIRHITRNNTLTMARRNIMAHYDLSNDMFEMFLDKTMTYSCAIFKHPTESLEDAQRNKLHALIDKANIKPYHKVLEIGFGWGSLSIETVKRTGCNVTGITLSQEQLTMARERVLEAGLEDKIDFKLIDYRELRGVGCFDRILSCEMLEAVGHEYYGTFFENCDRLLAPNGLLVVQVISTPEERYEEYRKSSDFIKEYIFPGSTCPSLNALVSAMTASSSFSVENVDNIGPHYAPTLLRWRERFMAKKQEIMALGFSDEFIRTWEYYFTYCAAGFQTNTLGDLQIVFSRPGNVEALGLPFN